MQSEIFTNLVLVAQKPGKGAPGGGAGSLMSMLFPFIAIGFLFYFLLLRPQRQEQSRRKAMLAALKKNDRVITAGGILGVVTNVSTDADEVTVKIDESTNTKIRVTRSSIARVLLDEHSGESFK